MIVPSWLEDVEGNQFFREGTEGYRSQILFHADEFESVPESHYNITATGWRISSRTTGPVPAEPVERLSPAPRRTCKSLLRARVGGTTGRLP